MLDTLVCINDEKLWNGRQVAYERYKVKTVSKFSAPPSQDIGDVALEYLKLN